jgi:hypothetical protein
MKNITTAFLTVVVAVMMVIVRSVWGQERPAIQTTVEPLRFHHVHLNSVDPVKAAEYYPKPFALSATKTTFNGYEAVKTGNVFLLFTRLPLPPRTS